VARFDPFPGIRYDLGRVELGRVLAPPYDVIDSAGRAELAARDAHNAVLVDLPDEAQGDERYAISEALLRSWLSDGTLVVDERPSFTVYRMVATDDAGVERRTTGVIGALELSPPGTDILPHEHTTKKAKSDRLDLLRSSRSNLSAIWGLSLAKGLTDLLPVDGAPLADVVDDDGVRHTVWRIDDPATCAAIATAVAEQPVVVADGHHRYETSLAYQREVGPGGEADYVLMALVSLDDPGLTVFPTHRLLAARPDGPAQNGEEALRDAVTEIFELEQVPVADLDPEGTDGVGVFGFMESHYERCFRLRLRDRHRLDQVFADRSEAYRTLDAAILEELVLKGIAGMTTEDIAAKRGIGYTPHIGEVFKKLTSGDYQAGFVLRATPVDQVRAVAAAGETMPPKSTYFFPKLLTGIAFNPLA
jgi:uncharacterized protein (DUF1015 family)